MGGTLNLNGGRSLSMGGRVPPRPPYNLNTGSKPENVESLISVKMHF